MIEVIVNNQSIKILSSELMVSKTESYVVHFTFSDEWDHLTKTAMFRLHRGTCPCYMKIGNVYSSQIDDGGYCKIPPDVLIPGTKLEIGAYGMGENITLPTTWSNGIAIHGGAAG